VVGDDFSELFTPEVFDAYTEAVHELGRRQRVFDADEALAAMSARVRVGDAGDVVRLLDYLVGIGTLEALPRGSSADSPARWRYVG
jgi:hypothetical protein